MKKLIIVFIGIASLSGAQTSSLYTVRALVKDRDVSGNTDIYTQVAVVCSPVMKLSSPCQGSLFTSLGDAQNMSVKAATHGVWNGAFKFHGPSNVVRVDIDGLSFPLFSARK